MEGRSPAFTVTSSTDFSLAENANIARRVEGTISAPCFLTNGCAPGGHFSFDRRGRPKQQGTTTYKYYCQIPRSALDPATPPKARPSLYGHGLLGDPATEVDAGNVESMSNEHNFVFCATAWAGFAAEDLGNIIAVLGDLSKFNTVADRMQQGFVQQLYLGRALIHPQGLSSNPAFQKNGQSVIDTRRLFYDGNSQGGIMGGALTALAPDYDRAVLGVPGMNYSTLLQRSVDFDDYAPILYGSYPKELERQLWLAQIQLLWDRGESDGYAHHITAKAAAEHAEAQRAHARGVRRSPGGGLHALDHGPDLRGRCPPAGARSGPFAAGQPVLRAQAADAAVEWVGTGPVGRRPAANGGRGDAGHAAGAAHQHSAVRGCGPAQCAAQRGERPCAEVRVPEARRADRGGVRRKAVLRAGLHRGALAFASAS